MTEHEHNFVYQGMIYVDSDQQRLGSGAHYRYYAHVYFCSQCMEKSYELTPEGYSSYDKVSFNATPGSVRDKNMLLDQNGWPHPWRRSQ